MKYKCPKCGTIFSGESDHCPNCGLKLKYKKQENNNPQTKPEENKTQPELFTNLFNTQNNPTQKQVNPDTFKDVKVDENKPTPTPTQKPDTNKNPNPNPNPNPTPTPTPKQPTSKVAKTYFIFVEICLVIAAGLYALCLLTPIYTGTTGSVTLNFASLDYFVYLISEYILGNLNYVTDMYFLMPAYLAFAALGAGIIITVIGLIINTIRLFSKSAAVTRRTYSFGTTPFMLVGIFAMNMMLYFPQMVNAFTPIKVGIISSIDQILFTSVYGTYVAYFVLRLIQKIKKNKAI